MRSVRAWSAGFLVALAGCNSVCEEPLSNESASVDQANLSSFWSDPEHGRLVVVRASAPYSIPDFAVDKLKEVLVGQAGLEIEVIEGDDPDLPATGVLNVDEVIAAGRLLAPDSIAPVVVVVEVSDSNYGGYGMIEWVEGYRAIGVVVVHRDAAVRGTIGPVRAEDIEALTLIHEVGHWLGVPARDHHTSSIDSLHCTNARCAMYKGSRVNACAILANLPTGPPFGFCEECREELAALQRRRAH